MRGMTVVLLHSRVERTPQWDWMCVFSLGREAEDLVGRAVLCTPLSVMRRRAESDAPYQHMAV
jgi:hypothetical protein